MSWKWIVGPERAANALRFATKEECEAYGTNLAWRWFGMPEPSLAVECDDPVTENNEQHFRPAFHQVRIDNFAFNALKQISDDDYERAAEDAARIADAREGFDD